MSKIDYLICGRKASAFPTLTDELASLGIRHEACTAQGRRRLIAADGSTIGELDAASGWHFVRLVKCGALRSAATVREAIECATLDLLG